MGVFEIISAVLLIISCVIIVLIVLMQESKQGSSQAISGASADNYFQKNSGRSKEAKLNRITKVAAILFFIVAIIVNVASVVSDKNTGTGTGSVTPAVTTSADAEATTAPDAETTTAATDSTTAADTSAAE